MDYLHHYKSRPQHHRMLGGADTLVAEYKTKDHLVRSYKIINDMISAMTEEQKKSEETVYAILEAIAMKLLNPTDEHFEGAIFEAHPSMKDNVSESMSKLKTLTGQGIIPIKIIKQNLIPPSSNGTIKTRFGSDLKLEPIDPSKPYGFVSSMLVLKLKRVVTSPATFQKINANDKKKVSYGLNLKNNNYFIYDDSLIESPNQNIFKFIDTFPKEMVAQINNAMEVGVYQFSDPKTTSQDVFDNVINDAMSRNPTMRRLVATLPLRPTLPIDIKVPSTSTKQSVSVPAPMAAPVSPSTAMSAVMNQINQQNAAFALQRNITKPSDVICNVRLFDTLSKLLNLSHDISIVNAYETKLADKMYELSIDLKERAVVFENMKSHLANNPYDVRALSDTLHAQAGEITELFEVYKVIKAKHAVQYQYREEMERKLDLVKKEYDLAIQCAIKEIVKIHPTMDPRTAAATILQLTEDFKKSHVQRQRLEDATSTVLHFNAETGKQSHQNGLRERLFHEPHAMCRVSDPNTNTQVDVEIAMVQNMLDPEGVARRRASRRRSVRRRASTRRKSRRKSTRKSGGRRRTTSRRRKNSFRHFK